MTPEQAAIILDFLYPQVVDESKTTRKVLAAVPADQCKYRPDPKSMCGLDLAAHIAVSEKMFYDSILTGVFRRPDPVSLDTPEAVVEFYDAQVLPLQEKIKQVPPAKLTEPISAFAISLSGIALLNISIKHSVHHRGQLAASLRAMGGKVPAIYGGSADEPFRGPDKA